MTNILHYRYDTFSQRIGAAIIDGLVLLPFVFGDELIFAQRDKLWLILLWMPVSYSVYLLYTILGHGLYGQTLGKRAAGIRVLDNATEQPITILQAARRESPWIVFTILILAVDIAAIYNGFEFTGALLYARVGLGYATFAWIIVEIVSCLFNSKRRAVHDLIGGTVVVRDNVPLMVSEPAVGDVS